MQLSARRVRWRLRWAILAGLVALFVSVGYLGESVWNGIPAKPRVVAVPDLSEDARAGGDVFDRRCSTCHGRNAAGSVTGPPLVHRIYRPAHHADIAFALAIQRGVRSHHWQFGDMPSQPGLSAREVEMLVRYVRELQRANGIE
jgi:mono/diheme cytochrome c family protein